MLSDGLHMGNSFDCEERSICFKICKIKSQNDSIYLQINPIGHLKCYKCAISIDSSNSEDNAIPHVNLVKVTLLSFYRYSI